MFIFLKDISAENVDSKEMVWEGKRDSMNWNSVCDSCEYKDSTDSPIGVCIFCSGMQG